MCTLCDANPLSAVDGTHDTLADLYRLYGPEGLASFGDGELVLVFPESPDFRTLLPGYGAGNQPSEGGWWTLTASPEVSREEAAPRSGFEAPTGDGWTPPGFAHSSDAPAPDVSERVYPHSAPGSDQGSTGSTAELVETSESAPSPLGDLADYLRVGYWVDKGSMPHQFNLTDSGTAANSGVLHYNVSGFSNISGAGTDTDGISAARADLVREAFKLFEEVLGIDFVETTSTDTNIVDFFFKDNASGAFANAYYYSDSGNVAYSWINVAASWSGGTSTYNDYTLQTIFHEIGHALGLGHQGSYNGSGGYPGDALFENDSWQASMMSYFSQTENTTIDASYELLQTPMSVDWMALDDIYGSQSYAGQTFGVENAFTGDTVYGFNTNISSTVSDIWANFSSYAYRTASTIVDAGGIDTLDFSGYAANQTINLTVTDRTMTAPSISDIGGSIGNLTLAEGTVIERAIGGSGNDTFFGNAADNWFNGNGGDDTFHDSAGSDTYLGGAGTDEVTFLGSFASYSFDLAGAFLQVIDATIDFVEDTIEWLGFSDQRLSFTYVVNSISPNTPPVAADDGWTIGEDVVLSGLNVLGNDSDADSDPLTVTEVKGDAGNVGSQITLTSGALLTVQADGSVVYDQNGAFDNLAVGETATETFTYTASDGRATDSATVTITIEGAFDTQPPVAADDSYSVGEGATLAANVLGNDSDPDGGSLSVTEVNGAAIGSQITLDSGALLTMNADGSFDYDPNGAFDALETGQTGSDGFTYAISDGQGGTDTASVSITIEGASPAVTEQAVVIDFEGLSTGPYAGADDLLVSGLTVSAGNDLTGSRFGLTDASGNFTLTALGEDFDLDAIELRTLSGRARVEVFAYDDGVLTGTAVFNPRSNKITDGSFDGTFDSVDHVVFSGSGQFAVDDITLLTRTTVDPGGNRAPVAADDSFSTDEATAIAGNLLAENGGDPDTDPDGDPLTLVSVDGDTDGPVDLTSGAIVTFSGDGSFTYNPNGAFDDLVAGETANDSFIYVIEDDAGGTDTGVVTVAVAGIGDPPPAPETVVIGFETGIGEDGFVFADTEITTRADGVASGSYAGKSIGNSLSFSHADGQTFDFASGVFTAVSGKNVDMTVYGYLNEGLVGEETIRIRDHREAEIALSDAIFDEVDTVVITAAGGVIVDDLILIV